MVSNQEKLQAKTLLLAVSTLVFSPLQFSKTQFSKNNKYRKNTIPSKGSNEGSWDEEPKAKIS